jgi:RNA polymerase sigma-70 factor (ECF subfamily)
MPATSNSSAVEQRDAISAADFDAVVATYRPKVFRFALASLRDPDAAQTVTQDCFLKAFQAWSRFRHECSLDTWLMTIAVNLIRDHTRNRRLQFWKRTSQESEPAEIIERTLAGTGPTPEAQVILREQVKAIWSAAAVLPPRQRTVFLLRFVEEMELLEIAAATGMKEGTVKAHLFQALRTVRQRVGAIR